MKKQMMVILCMMILGLQASAFEPGETGDEVRQGVSKLFSGARILQVKEYQNVWVVHIVYQDEPRTLFMTDAGELMSQGRYISLWLLPLNVRQAMEQKLTGVNVRHILEEVRNGQETVYWLQVEQDSKTLVYSVFPDGEIRKIKQLQSTAK